MPLTLSAAALQTPVLLSRLRLNRKFSDRNAVSQVGEMPRQITPALPTALLRWLHQSTVYMLNLVALRVSQPVLAFNRVVGYTLPRIVIL